MILVPLLIATGPSQGALQDRVPSSFRGKATYPPIYRMADGRVSIRFKACVDHSRFTRITCLEPQKLEAEWFMDHPVKTVNVNLPDELQPQEFEIRFCNVSFNDEYPATYSFWRRSAAEVSK